MCSDFNTCIIIEKKHNSVTINNIIKHLNDY